jgi:hypothetical protein
MGTRDYPREAVMTRVGSSSERVQPDDLNRHQTAPHDGGDSAAGREQSFSHDREGHLGALRRRPAAAIRSAEAEPEPGATAPRDDCGPGDADAAAAAAAQPGRAGLLARRAGNAVVNGMVGAWKLYVGVSALSIGYRFARNPRDIIERPIAATIGAGWCFGERVNEHTIAQGRAAVIERHGNFIPPDSACYGIEPKIDDYLYAGDVERANEQTGDHRPTGMRLGRFLPLGGGRHAVHHEYLHCFTHPAFASALSRSPHARIIEEALTEHFADRLPGHSVGKLSKYDFNKLPNGKRWSAAAAELEQAVGSETLQRAYFGGDADAIRAVSAAAIGIWPRDVTNAAWRSIKSGSREHQRRLAECFVGAALIATGMVPPEPVPGSGNNGNWAMDYLPITKFSKITPQQAQALQTQAEALRARHGPTFDQAFYGFDEAMQGEAMASIRKDIHAAWKPVL